MDDSRDARENYNATAAAATTTTPATRTARRVALESSSATRTRSGDGGANGGGSADGGCDADGGLVSLRGSPWVAFAGSAVGGALGGVHSAAVRLPLALHSAATAVYPS